MTLVKTPEPGILESVFGDVPRGVLVAVAAGAAPAAAQAAVVSIGFTSEGIAAGSIAASMMSGSAIASGGGVPAGGVVAILQWVGTVALGSVAFTGLVCAGVGALVWYAMGGDFGFTRYTISREPF